MPAKKERPQLPGSLSFCGHSFKSVPNEWSDVLAMPASGHQTHQLASNSARLPRSGKPVIFESHVAALAPAQRRPVTAFGKTP